MNLVIDIPEVVQDRIRREAQRVGVSTTDLVKGIVLDRFAPTPVDADAQKRLNTASISLLQKWLDESETDDPEELRRAEEEARQFKRNLNAPRRDAGARLLFPDAEVAE
jgi:chaperonin GroEL (HSP60 family)